MKKSTLGRNLGDLGINELLTNIENEKYNSLLKNLEIEQLTPGKYQPRKEIAEENYSAKIKINQKPKTINLFYIPYTPFYIRNIDFSLDIQ